MMPKAKRRFAVLVLVGVAMTMGMAFCYVKAHPLIFNESFWTHAHCIAQTGLSLRLYAEDHDGQFPVDTNGYGNALLRITNEVNFFWACLTGPGYDGGVFASAARTGKRIAESECGRVYVQGLRATDDPEVVLLFDKIPTPGGDHCHGFRRLWAPLGREVALVDGSHSFVREIDWPAFAKHQVELLVTAGMPKEQAEMYYSEVISR